MVERRRHDLVQLLRRQLRPVPRTLPLGQLGAHPVEARDHRVGGEVLHFDPELEHRPKEGGGLVVAAYPLEGDDMDTLRREFGVVVEKVREILQSKINAKVKLQNAA